MRAILITGSRNWKSRGTVANVIDDCMPTERQWMETKSDYLVIHGDHGYGADRMARQLCNERNIPQIRMPAQWETYGNAAGPIRNQHMVDVCAALQACGWKVEVRAFPLGESKGTRDCIKRAQEAGLKVIIHEKGNE